MAVVQGRAHFVLAAHQREQENGMSFTSHVKSNQKESKKYWQKFKQVACAIAFLSLTTATGGLSNNLPFHPGKPGLVPESQRQADLLVSSF